MGLIYELTKYNSDFTPLAIKALSSGAYGIVNGVVIAPTATGITVDQTLFNEYDASLAFNGTTSFLSTTGISFNSDAHKNAGQRLMIVHILNTLPDGNYALYEWKDGANDYEYLYFNRTGSNFTIFYKVAVGGVVLYNVNAAFTPNPDAFNVFQVCYSPTGAGTGTSSLQILINGSVVVASTASAANTLVNFSGALTIGKVTIPGAYFFSGRFDQFLIRKGRMYSWYHGGTTATGESYGWGLAAPTWSRVSYGSTAVTNKDLGSAKTPSPTVFNHTSVPQNIPCFCEVEDKLFITGIGNRKVYSITLRDRFLLQATSGGAGNVDAGTTDYAVTLLDSTTGYESQMCPIKSIVHGGSALQIDLDILAGCDSARADYIKIYRRHNSAQWYYVGIMSATIVGSGTTHIGTYRDNIANADLTTIANTSDDDLIVQSAVGLNPPAINSVAQVVSAASNATAGTYSVLAVNVDPHGRVISSAVVSADVTIGANDYIRVNYTGGLGSPFTTALYIKNKTNGEQYWYLHLTTSVYDYARLKSVTVAQNVDIDPSAVSATRYIDVTLAKPVDVNVCELHQDRMFYGCSLGNVNRLYFSESGQYELVGSARYIDIGAMDEPITCLKSHLGNLIIWKERSVYLLIGEEPQLYEVKLLTDSVGTVAHQTVKVIDNLIIWADTDNVFVYDGSTITPIADDLRDIIKNSNILHRPVWSAAIDEVNALYLLSIRQAAGTTISSGDIVLVYNIRESQRERKFKWTSWDFTLTALNEGFDYIDKINKVYFYSKDAILGKGFGLFDPMIKKDLNNFVQLGFTWEWLSQPTTIDFGHKLKIFQINGFFEEITADTESITFGYKVDASLRTTDFTINTSTDRVRKKIATRSKFIQPYVKGNNIDQATKFLGFELSMKKVKG